MRLLSSTAHIDRYLEISFEALYEAGPGWLTNNTPFDEQRYFAFLSLL